jgi:beta-glucanase (GH16 family)
MRRYALVLIFFVTSMSLPGTGIYDGVPQPMRTADEVALYPSQTPLGQTGDWNLLFSDDFDGVSLDPDRWTTCYWWDNAGFTNLGNNELEWYQPYNVSVSNGVLKLRAQEQTINASDGITYHYTSGMVTTGRSTWDTSAPTRFVFQYGYAEMRARVPGGQGLWPAFWMLPDTHNSRPEIDVMEILGHEPDVLHMNFHYLYDDGSRGDSGTDWKGPDFSADWHTFGVDWQPDAIVWYVDGIERWRYTDVAHIPSQPLYLLANLAVGGDWPGPPDEMTPFPSFFEIDYVRVWKRKDQLHFLPTADTYVDSSAPTMNFGLDNSLYSDGSPTKTSYLTFDTSALGSREISSAKLRIRTTDDVGAGSYVTHTLKLVSDSTWDETLVTYENRPAVSTVVVGAVANTYPGTTYDVPLDTSVLRSVIGNVFSLALDSAGEDGLYFFSKENASHNPNLIVTIRYHNVQLPIVFESFLMKGSGYCPH